MPLIATAPHPAPAVRLFPWVPPGGYPDRFPYGWCTWWAAYNRHVTWGGNAGDWLVNARAQGVETSALPSTGAVVDPRLRVIGIEGLRVADASVFPENISNNLNFSCYMVGERLAALMAEE